MCRADRLTTSRGRVELPVIRLRTRRCRRTRSDADFCVRGRTPPARRANDLDFAPAMTYLPAFPTLRRICSPWYRTPLPLYGSGLRSLRMLAATSPTCCLSIPSTTNRVGVAERELQVLAPGLDAVADADDLERLAVAVGHAGHHVGDQRAGQPVQRADLALVAGAGDGDGAVGLGHLDGRRDLQAEGALGPLHGDLAAVDGDIHAAGHRDGHASDS